MAMQAIVDHLRANVPLPVGASRDETAAPPLKHAPKTGYVFPVREVRQPDGTGQLDLARFRVRLEYADDPAGEEANLVRDRNVSVNLMTAADGIANWIRSNRAVDAVWEHAQVDAIDYDTLRTLDFRGFGMEFSFYRQLGG